MIELSEEIAVPTAPAMELIVALPLIYLIRTSTPEFWSPFRWASLNRGSQPCFSDVSSRGTGRAARMAHGAPPGAALGAGEAPKSAETWARQWGRFGMSKAGGMDGTKVQKSLEFLQSCILLFIQMFLSLDV